MSGNSSAIKIQKGKDALFQFYSGTTYNATALEPSYIEHDFRIYKSNVTVPAGPFNPVDWTPIVNYGITGATNNGGASGTLLIDNSNFSINLRTISGGTNVTVQQIGDVIRISSVGGTGGTSFSGITSFSNVGGGAGLVGANISGGDNLELRRISGGTNIGIATVGNNINITTPLLQGLTGVTSLGGQTSLISGIVSNNLRLKSLSGGTNVTITAVGDIIRIQAAGGGGGTPGGATTQVQYNNAGAFGGDSTFTFCNTTKSIVFGQGNTAVGNFAQAQGTNSHANANFSHAEGNAVIVTGQSAHAEGSATRANGAVSHAEGCSTRSIGDASHAEGCFSCSIGCFSHAEGLASCSIGVGSHAEGCSTFACGIGSHAEGFITRACCNYSHAEGNQTFACGCFSHAEGFNGTATGQSAHAEGCATLAGGCFSHSEGLATCALAYGSHSEGQSTFACGQSSHAEGSLTRACGLASHAEGNTTCSVGSYSHSEGQSTISTGQASHAEGCLTRSIGDFSHSTGILTCSIGIGSFVGGKGFSAVGKSINACGLNSFNFSENDTSQVANDGANARASAILGGINHSIASGNTNAAIVGGTGIKLTGSSYQNVTAVPSLAIFTTPSAGGVDDLLTWNPTNKKVGKILQSTFAPAVYQNIAYVSKNGNDGTGTINLTAKPYLTIQAAITALGSSSPSATNRCLVYVMPGQYTSSITLATFIDLELNNAIIATDITNGSAVDCRILGNGSLQRLSVTAASKIFVECDQLLNPTLNTASLSVQNAGATVSVTCNTIGIVTASIGAVFVDADIVLGGVLLSTSIGVSTFLYVNANLISGSSAHTVAPVSSTAIIHANAVMYVNAKKVIKNSTGSTVNTDNAMHFSSFQGRAYINVDEVINFGSVAPLHVIMGTSGRIYFSGKVISRNAGGNIPAIQYIMSGGRLYLKSGTQLVGSGTGESITTTGGANPVVMLGDVYGKNANHVNIGVELGTFTSNNTLIID